MGIPDVSLLKTVVAAFLITAMAALVIFTSATALPSTCTACHVGVMAEERADAHESVPCDRCHRRSGVVGVVDLRLRMLPMLAASVGLPTPVTAMVASDRCLSCHDGVLGGPIEIGSLRMSHKEPFDAGMSCVDCHGASIHGGVSEAAGRIDMNDCLRCHVVSVASADCGTCHLSGMSRASGLNRGTFSKTHGAEWRTLHGMGDLNTCGACHTVARCESCHGTPLPHGYSWLNEHGAEYLQAPDPCARCHSQRFCDDCHGLQMPHPAGFRDTHRGEAANMADEDCLSCHARQSCDECHIAHAHPGLDAGRAAELRRRAGIND